MLILHLFVVAIIKQGEVAFTLGAVGLSGRDHGCHCYVCKPVILYNHAVLSCLDEQGMSGVQKMQVPTI